MSAAGVSASMQMAVIRLRPSALLAPPLEHVVRSYRLSITPRQNTLYTILTQITINNAILM